MSKGGNSGIEIFIVFFRVIGVRIKYIFVIYINVIYVIINGIYILNVII